MAAILSRVAEVIYLHNSNKYVHGLELLFEVFWKKFHCINMDVIWSYLDEFSHYIPIYITCNPGICIHGVEQVVLEDFSISTSCQIYLCIWMVGDTMVPVTCSLLLQMCWSETHIYIIFVKLPIFKILPIFLHVFLIQCISVWYSALMRLCYQCGIFLG